MRRKFVFDYILSTKERGLGLASGDPRGQGDVPISLGTPHAHGTFSTSPTAPAVMRFMYAP